MLKPKSAQESFYGNYLYDRIVPIDHLLRKINQMVDFSFANELVRDRYTPDFSMESSNNILDSCFYRNNNVRY